MDRARRGGTNSADHVVHGVVFVSTRRLDQAEHGDESPKASDILYIKAPAAPFTVNGEHTELGSIMAAEGGDCEEVLAQFAQAGVDVDVLAAQLQEEGAKSL
jgi:transaldolase